MRGAFVAMMLWGGCASSPSYEIPPATTPDHVDTIPCEVSLEEYCAAMDCPWTLDIIEQDHQLCLSEFIPNLTVCGDDEIVENSGFATTTQYFFRRGALFAMLYFGPPNGRRCLGGPTSFDAPQCDSPTRPSAILAACKF